MIKLSKELFRIPDKEKALIQAQNLSIINKIIESRSGEYRIGVKFCSELKFNKFLKKIEEHSDVYWSCGDKKPTAFNGKIYASTIILCLEKDVPNLNFTLSYFDPSEINIEVELVNAKDFLEICSLLSPGFNLPEKKAIKDLKRYGFSVHKTKEGWLVSLKEDSNLIESRYGLNILRNVLKGIKSPIIMTYIDAIFLKELDQVANQLSRHYLSFGTSTLIGQTFDSSSCTTENHYAQMIIFDTKSFSYTLFNTSSHASRKEEQEHTLLKYVNGFLRPVIPYRSLSQKEFKEEYIKAVKRTW